MNDLKTDLNLILRVKCESCGCQQTYISKDYGFTCIKCGNKKYEFLECYKDRNVPRIIPNGKVGNPTNQSVVTLLGTPTTVGELKALLANYSDDTSFGFRNQPIQSLHEINYIDFTAVVFDVAN